MSNSTPNIDSALHSLHNAGTIARHRGERDTGVGSKVQQKDNLRLMFQYQHVIMALDNGEMTLRLPACFTDMARQWIAQKTE